MYQTTDPSSERMEEHFVNRLLAQVSLSLSPHKDKLVHIQKGCQTSHRVIELELARQEYQLLTEEVKHLSGIYISHTSYTECVIHFAKSGSHQRQVEMC